MIHNKVVDDWHDPVECIVVIDEHVVVEHQKTRIRDYFGGDFRIGLDGVVVVVAIDVDQVERPIGKLAESFLAWTLDNRGDVAIRRHFPVVELPMRETVDQFAPGKPIHSSSVCR